MMTLRKEISKTINCSSFKNPQHYSLSEQGKMSNKTTDQICSIFKERLTEAYNSPDQYVLASMVYQLIKELSGEPRVSEEAMDKIVDLIKES